MNFIKNIKKPVIFLFAIGISIFFLFFVISCTWIGYSVKTKCQDAKTEYSGDCVQALTELLNDNNRGFKVRNSAIWALGQLGDSRALSVLRSYYTGDIPNKEPLNEVISQYELKKAINLVSGGTNITAVFWRYGIN